MRRLAFLGVILGVVALLLVLRPVKAEPSGPVGPLTSVPRFLVSGDARGGIQAAGVLPGIFSDVSVDLGPDQQSECAVAAQGSTLVAAFHDSRLGFTEGLVRLSFSQDGGKTWSLTSMGARPAGVTGMTFDPLVTSGVSGDFFAKADVTPGNLGETFGCLVSTSTGGTSFQPSVLALSRTADSLQDLIDHSWIDVDRSSGPNRGNLYAATSFADFDATDTFLSQTIRAARSTNSNTSWEPDIQVNDNPPSPTEFNATPVVATGPDGQVYVAWFQADPAGSRLMVDVSTDGGQTFGTDVFVANYANVPFTQFLGLVRCGQVPQIAVDNSNGVARGRVYLTWMDNDPSDGGGNGRGHLFLSFSDDQGATWSAPRRVMGTDGNNQIIPSIAVNPNNGQVILTYYSDILSTSPVLGTVPAPPTPGLDFFAVVGTPTATDISLSSPLRLTGSSIDVDAVQANIQFQPALGDYNGICFAGGTVVLPILATSDGEGIEVAGLKPLEGQGSASVPFDSRDLTVEVSAQGGTGSYTFTYDFGDGTSLTTSETTVGHTYASNGDFNVSVEARDTLGSEVTVLAQSVHAFLAPDVPLFDSGGSCWIATAAYGSALHPHVVSLRWFRDHVLLKTWPGRVFVGFYYSTAPPVARWIARHEWARATVRGALWPVVMTIEHPLAALALLLGAGLGMGRRVSRWRARRGAQGSPRPAGL
ncbi:MAG TPA: CFI-box-CTERM domain-containing protein [Candidatus Nitrosotenuis sp.]|nr:CFI-box-CTERM domain-containing protein [Candidatus Nitrosotenuis sp.]